ncbi:hypothetical protein V8E36_003054, partial [Tilletia maclaganii]
MRQCGSVISLHLRQNSAPGLPGGHESGLSAMMSCSAPLFLMLKSRRSRAVVASRRVSNPSSRVRFPRSLMLSIGCARSPLRLDRNQSARDGKRKGEWRDGEGGESSDSDNEDNPVPPSRKRSRPSAVSASRDIAEPSRALLRQTKASTRISNGFWRGTATHVAFDHDEHADRLAAGREVPSCPDLCKSDLGYSKDSKRRVARLGVGQSTT